MLLKRLLQSLAGYFLAVAAVLSVIMIVPGLAGALGQEGASWPDRLLALVEPLPDLWRLLLPMALMLTVLIAFSRLSLRGEVKVWRSVGTSAWPFARAVALVGLMLSALITGPFWTMTQPTDASSSSSAPAVLTFERADDGSTWKTNELGADLVLFGGNEAILLADAFEQAPDGGLHLVDARLIVAGETEPLGDISLRQVNLSAASPSSVFSLTYRLTYPLLVIGLGLIMLPLALSIDGQRWTVFKIVGGCLLALNILFLLLMSDALVRANFWDSTLFFSGRAALALCIGLLLILIFEERSA